MHQGAHPAKKQSLDSLGTEPCHLTVFRRTQVHTLHTNSLKTHSGPHPAKNQSLDALWFAPCKQESNICTLVSTLKSNIVQTHSGSHPAKKQSLDTLWVCTLQSNSIQTHPANKKSLVLQQTAQINYSMVGLFRLLRQGSSNFKHCSET